MDKPDLDIVFAAKPGDEPLPPMLEEEGEEGATDTVVALDGAIDDLFAAEDPVQRREAFKRACQLCRESGY